MRLHRDFLATKGLLSLLLAFSLYYVFLFPAPSAASPLTKSVDLIDTLNLTRTLEPHVPVKRYYNLELAGVQEKGNPPPISDYPPDDEIRYKFLPEMRDRRFVFYCMVDVRDDNGNLILDGSTVARNFARSIQNGAFLRDFYPLRYTNRKPPGGVKRSLGWYQNFCDRFSGVMADNAWGEVYFVFNQLDWTLEDPNTKERVWARVEYPTLIRNPAVTRIIIVHWDTRNNVKLAERTLWSRGGNEARAVLVNETEVTVTRRTIYPDGGFNWIGCGEDPGDPYSGGYRPCCD